MPLKLTKRANREGYYIRGTVKGITVFESAGTSDRKEAEQCLLKRQHELWQQAYLDVQPAKSFLDCVESFLDQNESGLRSVDRRNINRLVEVFKDHDADQIGQAELDGAYKKLLGPDVSEATKLRHVLSPLRSILNHGARRGWCKTPHFEKPKVVVKRRRYIIPTEITALIQNAAPHLQPLLTFLVGTGARPLEAFKLTWADVDLRASVCTVGQKQGDWRRIDMPPVVCVALANLPHREGHVFRRSSPRIDKKTGAVVLAPPYRIPTDERDNPTGQIKRGFRTAAKAADWKGEVRISAKTGEDYWHCIFTPYDLRHTWASWHYCIHKDLLKLKADGGWQTIEMVMHYAKFMPDTYRDEISCWINGSAAAKVPMALTDDKKAVG